MYEDKTLVCKECGQEFVFTAGEQEFYAERGFQNEPQRCKACRDARKNAARGPRVFHRCLRCLRRRGEGSLRAQVRPSRLLQRVLCQDARSAEITSRSSVFIIAIRQGAQSGALFLLFWGCFPLFLRNLY